MKTKPLLLISFCLCSLAFGQTSVTLDSNFKVRNAIVNFGTGNTVDFTGSTVDFTGATVTGLSTGSAPSDTAFASSWNGVTTIAPSKNAVYDWAHTFDTDDDGKVNVLDQGAGIPLTDANGVLLSPITDNSSNWNTAYTDRLKWDGGATGLVAATGRTSLGLAGINFTARQLIADDNTTVMLAWDNNDGLLLGTGGIFSADSGTWFDNTGFHGSGANLTALNIAAANVTGRIGNTNLPLGAQLSTPNSTLALNLAINGQIELFGGTAIIGSDGIISAGGFSGSGTDLQFPGSLSIASGKTLTASNSLTLLGTDGSTLRSTWVEKTTTYTAVSGDLLLANTSGGAFTITLPASPSVGMVVTIADAQGTFATNNLTVGRNSQSIGGSAANMTASTDNAAFMLIFAGGTMGWQIVRYQ